VLPIASDQTLGGVKVGNNLSIDPQTGVMSATDTVYSLPNASPSVLGGIKVGTNLSIDANGVLSATDTTYSAGAGISISDGVISVSYPNGDNMQYGS
jgi:hypothetical protein